MPFNRVTDLKATVLWLLILNKENEDRKYEQSEDKSVKRVHKIPTYIPGLMLIPIPEAGWINGYVDMAFWAVFLYVLGSVFYVIASGYEWVSVNPDYTDDALNPANYMNTLAAVLFVANAIICFVDWHLQYKQLSAFNMSSDDDISGGLVVEEIPQKLSMYYFYNNLFFLGAAVVYMIQSIWMENPNTDIYDCSDTL